MENFNRILEVTAAVISYYKEHPFEPTEEDCTTWLNGLDNPIKKQFESKGLQGCLSILDFQIFYLESRDKSMNDYLKNNLTGDSYEFWRINNPEKFINLENITI